MTSPESDPATPLDQLGILASQSVDISSTFRHLEAFTAKGLHTILWHGSVEAECVVAMCGGAMGGLLGAGGMYHSLGESLAELGIGSVRVGYRQPNDLEACTVDLLAAMQLTSRHGATRFITVGHSFGGAIAIRAAAYFERDTAPGVVTLATQSAGCEPADQLGDRELLFFHGDSDQILPHQSSEMVRHLAGTGELVILPDGDHLLASYSDHIQARLQAWIPDVFAAGESKA